MGREEWMTFLVLIVLRGGVYGLRGVRRAGKGGGGMPGGADYSQDLEKEKESGKQGRMRYDS